MRGTWGKAFTASAVQTVSTVPGLCSMLSLACSDIAWAMQQRGRHRSSCTAKCAFPHACCQAIGGRQSRGCSASLSCAGAGGRDCVGRGGVSEGQGAAGRHVGSENAAVPASCGPSGMSVTCLHDKSSCSGNQLYCRALEGINKALAVMAILQSTAALQPFSCSS